MGRFFMYVSCGCYWSLHASSTTLEPSISSGNASVIARSRSYPARRPGLVRESAGGRRRNGLAAGSAAGAAAGAAALAAVAWTMAI